VSGLWRLVSGDWLEVRSAEPAASSQQQVAGDKNPKTSVIVIRLIFVGHDIGWIKVQTAGIVERYCHQKGLFRRCPVSNSD
jgi:hypothetical protein